MITGGKEDAQTYELELPLTLWQQDYSTVSDYTLKEETIASIIDWAERFNAALKGQ
jgi:hypothetical protein